MHLTSILGLLNKARSTSLEIKENNIDTDLDGLTDMSELPKNGTDPTKEDSDDDSINDKKEIEIGTNPLSKDSGEF